MPGTAVQVLTINAGSSSVRLAAFDADGHALARSKLEDVVDDPPARIADFLSSHRLGAVSAVAHRVVHGGLRLTEPCRIDADVEQEIEDLVPLAPLHNPRALSWIRAVRAWGGSTVPQFAVFDTSFYAALPPEARAYALPAGLCERHGIRRYGFHGIAHEAMWRAWSAQGVRPKRARVISLQLGAGCSMTASEDGRPRETSMGFSPLEGLVMATRCGDLDPGVLLYLQRVAGLDLQAVESLLNRESGLRGLSGSSGDMRELLDSPEPGARLAVDIYCRRARRYLGGYLALLGGADAILFGGGVGENAAAVRAAILQDMAWAGIRLDPTRNRQAVGQTCRLSHEDSAVEVWTIAIDEAAILAEQARRLLRTTAARQPEEDT